MRTYREFFAVPEFRLLFVNRCIVMVSVTASTLALGTITYDATGSAILTGLSMFGGPLISLVASNFLLGASDSVRPRTALLIQIFAAFVADALQAVPGMPWQFRFVLLAIPFVVNSAFSGTQWSIVRELVPPEAFVFARATMNIAVGGMQIVGYGVGGIVLLFLSPRELFIVAAIADLVCLVTVRLGIKDRPPRVAAGNLVRRTRAVNGRLLSSPVTRPMLLTMWVPNGLIVGCESLFIPYGGGSGAGSLFAATAAGMLTGDVVMGRFVPARMRDRLIRPLRYLLAAPYLGLALGPPLWVVMALGCVASAGYSASLPLQDRLLRHTDEESTGQTMGLFSQGLMIWQAVGALIGGAVAAYVHPRLAIVVMAAASLLVTTALSRGLHRSAESAEPMQPANV